MFLGKDGYERTAWSMASEKGQVEILHKLWDWAKSTNTRRVKTAWHRIVEQDNLEELRKLCECVKEIVTPEDLNNKLMLAKAEREYTVWQVAALMGN